MNKKLKFQVENTVINRDNDLCTQVKFCYGQSGDPDFEPGNTSRANIDMCKRTRSVRPVIAEI